MCVCVYVSVTVTEAEPTKTEELTCPEDLISKIQPYLGPALVREFSCIYKFVVVDDSGAAIYHLDLKHGRHCLVHFVCTYCTFLICCIHCFDIIG